MTTLILTESNLFALKKLVRAELPNVSSSHVSEALAAALGFKKYATLLVEMQGSARNPHCFELDNGFFIDRLEQLGHDGYQHFSFEDLDL